MFTVKWRIEQILNLYRDAIGNRNIDVRYVFHVNPSGTGRLEKTEIDYSFFMAQFLMSGVSKP